MMPRLQTRANNKLVKPAVRAGLVKENPTPRRSPAQMEQARAAEASAKKKAQNDTAKSLQHLAAVEDAQQEEDTHYLETANHPAEDAAEYEVQDEPGM
jgi:hypothetical protein